MRRIAIRGLVVVALVGALLIVDVFFGGQLDAEFAVRITGKVVDERTGKPVVGAWVMTLPCFEQGRDDDLVKKWTRRLQHEGVPMSMYGGSRTASDGSFSFLVEVPWGWNEGGSGLAYGRTTPPPFYALGACVVDAKGFERGVQDPKRGEWDEAPDHPDLFARLRLGTIRIRRMP